MASQRDEMSIDPRAGRLFTCSWVPGTDPRAVLFVVPGGRGHGAHYERVATVLVDHEIAVHVIDPRYLDDLDAPPSSSPLQRASLPLFMLGHGAGAVTASLYALTRQQTLAGLICESIALDLPASATLFGLVRALATIAPELPIKGASSERFSRDAEFVERMNRDPQSSPRQPARDIAALERARARLRASLADLSLPLLALHGSADTVTLPSGSEYLHEHAGSPDKTLQIFEGYYHDLINDRGHGQVIGRILQWIETRLDPGRRGQIGIAYINADS